MLQAPVVGYADMESLLKPRLNSPPSNDVNADAEYDSTDDEMDIVDADDNDDPPSSCDDADGEFDNLDDITADQPIDNSLITTDPATPSEAFDQPPLDPPPTPTNHPPPISERLPSVGVVDADVVENLDSEQRKRVCYQDHEPISYFTRFVATDPNMLPESDPTDGFEFPQTNTYVGEDSVRHMIEYLIKVADKVHEKLFPAPELQMSAEDTARYESETSCHICQKKNSSLRHIQHAHRPEDDTQRCGDCKVNERLTIMDNFIERDQVVHHVHPRGQKRSNCADCKWNGLTKVRDHDHVSGSFRGTAHSHCNLQYRLASEKNWTLPVFYHNFSGYDCHHVINALSKEFGTVRLIPNNMQRFMAVQVGRVLFLDSMEFAKGSLASLVDTMDEKDFVETKKFFGIPDADSPERLVPVAHAHPEWEQDTSDCEWCIANRAEEKIQQTFLKGVFPYDHLDSLDRMTETSLPDREAFYNKLNDTEISWAEERHAKRVWEVQGCETLKDYHDFYLKTDVLLLADFFEKFRNFCLTTYGLDAAHYFSTPGLAIDAALKTSGVTLAQIDNAPMYDFFESSIRGGISQISLRHAKANNPAADDFDPDKPNVQLIYLDCNNLYGYAMSQLLPTGGFRWLEDEEIENLNVESLDPLALLGYVLEVDLEIPDELHDKLNDFPPAPETITIDSTLLSPFQELFPESSKKSSRKLAPNLLPKRKYVTHYRNLQFYLNLGCKLKKIHRVLEFTQYDWLEKYIGFNTRMRAAATSDFARDYLKLMNNSVFGKTQENLRKRISVEVVTDENIAKKRTCSPKFKRSYTIREDLVIMGHHRTSLELNRAIYTGFAVLELSKLWMYDFHYDKMHRWFDDIKLLFTDTDSLCYRICDDRDIYDVMNEHREYFDFSGYPRDHRCYSTHNKKQIGKFKDELNSLCLEEFVGLRPKSYSIKFRGRDLREDFKRVAKGTKYRVKETHLTHEHYLKSLQNWENIYVRQNTILSINQKISTFQQCRSSLTCYDTKRWIRGDGIHTLAHGHYLTR